MPTANFKCTVCGQKMEWEVDDLNFKETDVPEDMLDCSVVSCQRLGGRMKLLNVEDD